MAAVFARSGITFSTSSKGIVGSRGRGQLAIAAAKPRCRRPSGSPTAGTQGPAPGTCGESETETCSFSRGLPLGPPATPVATVPGSSGSERMSWPARGGQRGMRTLRLPDDDHRFANSGKAVSADRTLSSTLHPPAAPTARDVRQECPGPGSRTQPPHSPAPARHSDSPCRASPRGIHEGAHTSATARGAVRPCHHGPASGWYGPLRKIDRAGHRDGGLPSIPLVAVYRTRSPFAAFARTR